MEDFFIHEILGGDSLAKKGLIIVHTGAGKGKTTAALGLAFRAWGQGKRVLFLQFIKKPEAYVYGEIKAIQSLRDERFVIRQMGEGFVYFKNTASRQRHLQAAEAAWQALETETQSGNWDMIVLDEINYAVHFGLLSEKKLLLFLAQKPPELHLVLTGRNALSSVIERADLVTEMKEVKHHYKQGIVAQAGIEF